MSLVRIALANLEIPAGPEDSLERALLAVAQAAEAGAKLVCFPEAYVPGYPWGKRRVDEVKVSFLERAHDQVARAAGEHRIAVLLGTERYVTNRPRLTVLVVDSDGRVAGYQDKVQLDPSEDARYEPGRERAVFEVAGLRLGIVICHEGFRYPETARWAARRGAQVLFHPHYDEAEPGQFRPEHFADPRGSFHEKAFLCRAAENSCFFAAVNCASAGSPTTSAVVGPDGSLRCYQPYGRAGLLTCDIDPAEATGLLARRLRD
jgi:predicted amidohydrolase